jgi:NADPH-dependent curcumin reductase CurA
MQNRRFVLAARPQGIPRESDFRLETGTLAEPRDGELLVANRFISVDPGMRARLSDAQTYAAPLAIGDMIESASVGEVIASRHPKFAAGDRVAAGLGWQEYALSDGRGLRKITDHSIPVSAQIGVLGIPGLTAYFGLLDIGKPKAGDTVLVSSAAGAVGATAGQIAQLHGARAIGIAGGADKCAWLVEELGFAAAIDRHAQSDVAAAVARACPQGIDILFDNAGNALIDAILPLMKRGGRIVVSGQIADYNLAPEERHGIRNTSHFITSRLLMQGLVVFDYVREFPRAWEEMSAWIRDGRLRYREDIEEGFEQLPRAFIGLFSGRNFGRKLVRLR